MPKILNFFGALALVYSFFLLAVWVSPVYECSLSAWSDQKFYLTAAIAPFAIAGLFIVGTLIALGTMPEYRKEEDL